jgi:hypothetical protein
MTRLLAVAMLALAALAPACGSARSSPPITPPPPPQSSPETGSGSAVAVAPPAPDAPPADAECDALVAHALSLEMAERPADQQLAEPERAKVLAQLREQQRPACRTLSREAYRCMLAAGKVADLASCT